MFASMLLSFAADLRVGFAEVEITPPVGYRIGGGLGEVVSDGVRDPLFAKALYLRQGETQAVYLIADLLSVPETLTDPVRDRIVREIGVARSATILSATHTHGGPEYHGPMRDLYRRRAIAKQGRDPHETVDCEKLLSDRFVRTIAQAKAAAEPVRLEVATTACLGLAFNRRFHMRDGTVRFNPGPLNPDIERPAGPTDPEFPILVFRRVRDDAPIGGLAVFAMHVAVHGGSKFSADYPGVLARRLRAELGGRFVSIFGQGTAGDVNHVDVTNKGPQRDSEEVGKMLAETWLAARPKLRPAGAPELAVRSAVVSWPLQQVTEERIARATTLLDRTDRLPVDFLAQVDAWRVWHVVEFRRRFGDRLPNEVQALRLTTEVAVVSLPHEVFVEIGLDVKRRSPFPRTFVVSMGQGTDFYLPTKRAFAEGGYEPTTCPLEPGVGEAVADAAVRLLKELKAEPQPAPKANR